MIKTLCNITLNEIIKKYKKKSLIIITLIIFLVGIGYPILVRNLTKNINDVFQVSYGFNVGEMQQNLKGLNGKTDIGKIQKAFIESQIKQQNLLSSVKANPTGWKAKAGQKYLTGLIEVNSLNLLKEGINPKVIYEELPKRIDTLEAEKILETNKANIDSQIDKVTKENAKVEKQIKDNDYLSYLKEDINVNNKEVKDLNKALDSLNKEKKKEGNTSLLKNRIVDVQNQLEMVKINLKINQYRYDHKISYDLNNWKNVELNSIQQNSIIANRKIMPENEYLKAVNNGVSYAKYKEVFNANKVKAENNVKLGWYSLNNNVPQISIATGTRSTVNIGVKIFVIIVAILGAVIASGIVSTEFSKGTIRLLLTRPIKRWKILLSKLLSVLIISYAVLFVSMIISTITSGILFGFSDLGNPVLKVVNGAVIKESYFGNLIGNLMFASITIIFIICVSFFLSTVAKSSAIAVAVSIILFIGSFPATLIMISKKMFWIIHSPIPYINLPIVSAIQNIDSQVLFKSNLGGVELLIVSLILIIISLLVFCKKDIVN